ncbi:unnamed protein product [Bursaphelenchus xylophilus]|uniref:(pine wood nematode) hypothetical protein n=1 Tax=Bursaphelenchus xylophilus TaxID=6326 RepID=A0A1I7SV94_BURXY|nr:unnamed protein product [Bursaphelenchus xylophilus]CAG9101099.1 unnamed protein product [Bursaphelenchus xylophilus]
MYINLVFLLFLLLKSSNAQLYGNSYFLNALRGYGNDLCRFVSCPPGQYCVGGQCNTGGAFGTGLTGGGVGGLGYGGYAGYGNTGYGLGYGASLALMNAAHKFCAETSDCYSGQICQAGRCSFTAGVGTPFLGANALGAGAYDGGYGALGTVGVGGTYNGLAGTNGLIERPSGVQMCNLMQDCLNGQICVNGYCSQSNVVYGGSQGALKPPPTCGTGATCPVGHFCIAGICTPNYMSSSSACFIGNTCPPGMICRLGRCEPNGFFGKKK